MTLILTAFVAVSSLILMVGLLASGKTDPLQEGVKRRKRGSKSIDFGEDEDLFHVGESSFKLVSLVTGIFSPATQKGRQKVMDRLVQAGLYKRGSISVYLVTRVLLIVAPMAIGFVGANLGIITLTQGLVAGAIAGLVGTIAPGFWLDYQRSIRQKNIRRAMPDALDVIVVCIEGGLSIPAAFAKVSSELKEAHPMLSSEMLIVQREIQMGYSTGQALKNFANRFDIAELRGLASVILQAECFGASIVNALRVHADSLREQRQMQAEEMAAKAAVKILIPTLLCIFPALFVVILGPAAFDIMELFENMNLNR